jgi:hypothetical protein
LHGGDQRLLEIDQRVDQFRLRTFDRSWRVLHKILDIIARTKRISRSMPKRDAYLIVFAAPLSNSAIEMYMLEVIAFFFAGRFSWMLRMFSENVVHCAAPALEFRTVLFFLVYFPEVQTETVRLFTQP